MKEENKTKILTVKKQPQIYFTADIHFGHKNILKYCKKRNEKIVEWARINNKEVNDDNIISLMDEWLIDLWNTQVSKKDTVYILGDFSFKSAEENKKLLSRLNGKKFLILGNHDGNSDKLDNYFEVITQIKELKYKPLDEGETIGFEMCHFPMVSWNRKEHGTIQLHGHCHNAMSRENFKRGVLRVDVGLDSDLADYHFVTPEMIIKYFDMVTRGKPYRDYTKSLVSKNILQRSIMCIVNSLRYNKVINKIHHSL